LEARLPRRPAFFARKIIYMLYSVFLKSPFCRAARESARTLALVSASRSGYVVLHPSYIPSVSEIQCEYDCVLHKYLGNEQDHGHSQSNAKNRCNHRVLSASDADEVLDLNLACSGVEGGDVEFSSQACLLLDEGGWQSSQGWSGIIEEVASSSTNARFSRRVSMRGKRRVPMEGRDIFSTVLRIRSADGSDPLVATGKDPNGMIPENSDEGESVFAAEYMVRSIIDTLTSVPNRHLSSDIAIAEALRHAVTDVSLNRAGCHMYVGCQLVKVLTDHSDVAHIADKVRASERLHTVLSASLCAIATFIAGNLPTDFWQALAPRCCEIYDSSRLYQAAEASVLHSDMQLSARGAHLAAICRMAIRSERDTRNKILVVPKDCNQKYCKAVATSLLPDAFDFAAMETMQLILMFDSSASIANEALNLVVDGIKLSPAGSRLECNVDGQYPAGNVRLRWIRLSIALFCRALNHVTCGQQAGIAEKLRLLSVEGNIGAALLLEYCTCFSSHLCSKMRHLDVTKHDHFFAVDAKPLPYLVSVRRLASGDALVCQRRATCASVQRISAFINPDHVFPVLSNLPSRQAPDVVQASTHDETMGSDLNVRSEILEIVSSYWPDPSNRPKALADLVKDQLDNDDSHLGVAISASTTEAGSECESEHLWAYGMLEQSGAGGANKIKQIFSVQKEDVVDIDDNICDEMLEIGVVYVPEDANSAGDILAAEWDGTNWYRFLEQLGTFVPFVRVGDRPETAGGGQAGSDSLDATSSADAVLTPTPYLGGLSRRSDGTHYLAYAERARQVVFVVPSLIPDGPQAVIRRESSTLNCKVVIVWNESGRRFDPATFDTQFLMVLIVISPTTTHDMYDDARLNRSNPFGVKDRYRVKVFSDRITMFGPLRPDTEGYLVPGDKLCSLVRLTAIHAHVAVVAELDKHAAERLQCEYRASAIGTTIANSSLGGS
jgi:hypothetical protein